MSQAEDDRAAKAARAKALLKKRQQQKTTGSRGAPLATSPPPSRSYTPAPTEDGKLGRDISDLFSSSDADANWVEPFPRAEIIQATTATQSRSPDPVSKSPLPPPERVDTPVSVAPTSTSTLVNPQVVDDLRLQVAEQQKVISSLQAEKSALAAFLTRLNEVQTDARGKENMLLEERSRCRSLEVELAQAKASIFSAMRHTEQLSQEKSRLECLHNAAQDEIGQLATRSRELDQKLSEAYKQMECLRSDVQRFTSDLRIVRQEADNARGHSTQVEGELSETRAQMDQLRGKATEESKRWKEQDQSRQQTISLLVSEKASLTTSLQRLEEVEIELQEKENLLRSEHTRSEGLSKRVEELETIAGKQSSELQEALSREKELLERCREQEREIQLRKAELGEVQATSNQHQQRVRELEDQIESDDRADRLEVSLQNTQDRADELEFQLNKLQQSHTSLKSEKDDLESRLSLKTASEAEWGVRHASLEADHVTLQGDLQSANTQRDGLLEERASLQSQVEFNQSAVKQLQQKLGELASEATSSDRALQNVQGELRAALRRAEESERTQKDLQAEGTRLMQSLEEMRPKFVELTSVKLELMEQIERLEYDKKFRDTLISQLEMALNEGSEREAEAAKLRKEADTLGEKDNQSLQQTIADLQQGYSMLEAELKSSQAAVQSLDAERTRMRQSEIRHADLSNRFNTEARRREEEISQLESALSLSRKNEAEQSQLITHYRSETEALQSELVAKEEELESIQKTPVTDDGPRSLDDEMLSALGQQHAMELSSAQSQIRVLETTVFEAQDKAHRLQRQIHVLEDQLASRSTSRATSRPFSPSARPSSRTSADLRRGSFSHKSSSLVPSTRSVFDVGLSPETRHKRQVSLSMLKARIDSEVAAHSHTLPPRGLSPVPDAPSSPLLHASDVHPRRPQFMDESHIFWCHSCRGDLVIL
ncbi:hypothetical protein BS17DRAFT_751107 [Gyrodon lividus]|nr:hypothetical protein BS17DRAFT_751107 [Gyrodon lividus]